MRRIFVGFGPEMRLTPIHGAQPLRPPIIPWIIGNSAAIG